MRFISTEMLPIKIFEEIMTVGLLSTVHLQLSARKIITRTVLWRKNIEPKPGTDGAVQLDLCPPDIVGIGN